MTAVARRASVRTFRSLRRHRNYRLFFTGQIFSVSGTWMQNVALAWLVIELTRSPLALGGLAFCRFVPFTLLGLVAGVVADRFDNRRLVMATQAISMALSVLLAILALSGAATLGLVYTVAALLGIALVFDAPGRHALTYQLVGPRELQNAVALNASLFNASRVVGPALAGVLIAWLGVGACFALNAVSFVAVLGALAAMREAELYPVERSVARSLGAGVREGVDFVLGSSELRTVLAVVTVVSTVGFNFHVILPLLASDTLHAGPRTLGLLSASFGLGALVGALVSASLGRASWKAFLVGTAGFSVALLALAPVSSAWPAAALLAVVGACFTLWSSNANAIVQLRAPGHLRGRAVSMYLFAFAGLAPVGGLVAGWLVDTGGTELSLALAGVTGLAAVALAGRERLRAAAAAPSPAG